VQSDKNARQLNPWALVFRRLAQAVLPADAFFELIPDQAGRVVLQSSWLMPEEVQGAVIRTHPIRIMVSADAVKDYSFANEVQRRRADLHFKDWLEQRLQSHTPRIAQAGAASKDEWMIDSNTLFQPRR
jgi:hypothetical protein